MAHLHQVVAAGVASGDLVDEDPRDLAGFVWATIAGYRTLVGDGRMPPDRATDVLVRLLGRAIRRGIPDTGDVVAPA